MLDRSIIYFLEVQSVKVIREPAMLLGIICTHPLFFIENKELLDEILGASANKMPFCDIFELLQITPLSQLLTVSICSLAHERRHSGQ